MTNLNNLTNIEVEGIDMQDYPKFCDAFIAYAETADGVALTEQELGIVNDDQQYYDVLYQAIEDHIH